MREVGAAIVAPKRRTPASLKKFAPQEIANWAPIIKESASRRSGANEAARAIAGDLR